jgi:hypothetical protein
MKTENSFINGHAETMEKFVSQTVDQYQTPKANQLRSKVEKNDLIIVVQGKGEKAMAIIGLAATKPSNGSVILKPELMSPEKDEKEIKVSPDDQIFVISSKKLYPGNFEGEHKKEFMELIKEMTKSVDKTVRIGGLYMPKEMKGTVEANRKLEEVEKWFDTNFPGLKLQYRWSDSSGKFAKIESGGYNILAKNEKMSEFNRLFKTGSHYYDKHQMFAFIVKDEKSEMEIRDNAPEFEAMIKEFIK